MLFIYSLMSKKYFNLSDAELLTKTAMAAQTEKEATLALLEYLYEVDIRKVYATKSFSSLFEYIVKELGFSESQASERVSAVRLMRSTPEVKVHLESGHLNLSTAAKIQRFVQAERKLSLPLVAEQKTALIQECLNQSKRSVDKILFEHASVPTKIAMQERVTPLGPELVKLTLTLDSKAEKKLKRAQELIRTETVAELLEKALDALIDQQEKKLGKVLKENLIPEIKPTLPTPPAALLKKNTSRYIPKEFKRIIYQRSGGKCEFVDEKSKKCCESRAHLEVDHVTPLAKNGKTELSNLRYLRHEHNQREAMNWKINVRKSLKASPLKT